MERKDKYRELCFAEDSIPIFSRDWWLDATAGPENWDVAIVEKGGKVEGALPFVLKKRLGFTYVTQPALTQKLGPWLRVSSAKLTKKLDKEKDILTKLMDQLPQVTFYQQCWDYSCKNWLPFYWRGYKQTSYYTYVLPDLSNLDLVWSGFRENIRSDCRKAEGRFGIRVRTDLGIDEFIKLNQKTFERQGIDAPDSEALIRRLDKACESKGARKIFIAEDEDGNNHAGVYIVWDENSAYYLMGGADPDLRNSGATSLCIWHAIQFAAGVTRQFDFEGSMLESVERFFRGFGAEQKDFFYVSKSNSRLFDFLLYVRELKKADIWNRFAFSRSLLRLIRSLRRVREE